MVFKISCETKQWIVSIKRANNLWYVISPKSNMDTARIVTSNYYAYYMFTGIIKLVGLRVCYDLTLDLL